MKTMTAADTQMTAVTVAATTTTTDMGADQQETPIADLPTLTDHLRAETMSGRVFTRPRINYGYQW